MTRSRALAEPLKRAQEDEATADDAATAAALLPTLEDPIGRYDALFVIGKAGVGMIT